MGAAKSWCVTSQSSSSRITSAIRRPGPCTPFTITCPMSADFDGPECSPSADGRSAFIDSSASRIVSCAVVALTTTTCVGARSCERLPSRASSTRLPVSAMRALAIDNPRGASSGSTAGNSGARPGSVPAPRVTESKVLQKSAIQARAWGLSGTCTTSPPEEMNIRSNSSTGDVGSPGRQLPKGPGWSAFGRPFSDCRSLARIRSRPSWPFRRSLLARVL